MTKSDVPRGCCSGCNGTGVTCDPETNGLCWDCRGTGCAHPDPCTSSATMTKKRTYTPREIMAFGMDIPWSGRNSTVLSDLYNADLRSTVPAISALSRNVLIPHPLVDVTYADGSYKGGTP